MKRWVTFVVVVCVVALAWWVMRSQVRPRRLSEVQLPSAQPVLTNAATPAVTQEARPKPAADTAAVAAPQTPLCRLSIWRRC